MIIRLIIGYFLLYFGALFLLLGAFGLIRLPDLYTRMQAATKSTTLGAFSSVLGVGILHPGWFVKCVVVALFILLTAPIGSSALMRAAYKTGVPFDERTVVDEGKEFFGEEKKEEAK